MKKILVLILLGWSLIGNGQTLIDSYPESNYNFYSSMYYYFSQNFTTTKASKITSAVIYARMFYGASGNFYAHIYAHSGTYGVNSQPTGTALATSDAIDLSTLGFNFALRTLTFSGANQITLTAATNYCLVIYCTDNMNLALGRDNISPTHPILRVSNDNTTYYTEGNHAMIFYLYGNEVLSTGNTLIFGTDF
ncbi:MAG: hypothetical protein WCK09_00410 [Bacteroidota bacterium]